MLPSLQLFRSGIAHMAHELTVHRRAGSAPRRWQPELLPLEDRLTPSTFSSIAANFNATAIPAGDYVWFSSALTATGLGNSPVTVHVENAAIDFTAGGTPYHVAVPNGVIVFTPGATSASASFDPTDNDWDVSVPSNLRGDAFMTGAALPVPNGLPGGIRSVTWSASFWSDTANVNVNWKWAAAVYTNFSNDLNAVGVKPVDDKNLSVYKNGDQSGTPEAYKPYLISGALGGGGTNYTGNSTPAKGVKPSLGNGLSDYPFPSSNPLTSVAFNESTVLKAANLDLANGAFEVWYSDEHALALGVRQVNVKTASGTTTTNYAVTALTSDPGVALNAAVGTTATTGDQAGTDLSGRPIAPSLYITDTTNDPTSRSGDWQYGGTAIAPTAVFGTWKAFVRTVDNTTSPATVTVTGDADPAKNNWNLGAGSDAPPTGVTNEGYGAEMRWSLDDLRAQGLLVPGHTYRFYVIVHDGDQNKVGGDAGQAAFNYSYPAPATPPSSLSGFVYYDVNGNGAFDAGETPLNGVTVTLSDANGNALQTATTDANGYYAFTSLVAGTYTITEFHPPGYTDQTISVGSQGSGSAGYDINGNAAISAISLLAGVDGTDNDFGEGFRPS